MRFPVRNPLNSYLLLSKKMFLKSKYHYLIIIFLSIAFGGCESKTKLQAEKQKTVSNTTSEIITPKYESTDTLQFERQVYGIDDEGNPVHGRVSIEGTNGIGLLTISQGRTIEVVLDKGKSNRLIATDIEGFKYNLILQ